MAVWCRSRAAVRRKRCCASFNEKKQTSFSAGLSGCLPRAQVRPCAERFWLCCSSGGTHPAREHTPFQPHIPMARRSTPVALLLNLHAASAAALSSAGSAAGSAAGAASTGGSAAGSAPAPLRLTVGAGPTLPLPHIWENTGWCPPDSQSSALAMANYSLQEASWQQHAFIAAVPNRGIKYVPCTACTSCPHEPLPNAADRDQVRAHPQPAQPDHDQFRRRRRAPDPARRLQLVAARLDAGHDRGRAQAADRVRDYGQPEDVAGLPRRRVHILEGAGAARGLAQHGQGAGEPLHRAVRRGGRGVLALRDGPHSSPLFSRGSAKSQRSCCCWRLRSGTSPTTPATP
eukprot:COSAG04_NODE_143_length_23569_cov_6.195356_14_plen_345_part_00